MSRTRTERSYTKGMKTAVTIPDRLFADAERLAERLKRSRSHLYAEALAEYVARHAPAALTDALNQACDAATGTGDPFAAAAGRRALRKSKW